METFVVLVSVILAYVQIFNKVASLYFDSDRTMSWTDLYRRFIPAATIEIHL